MTQALWGRSKEYKRSETYTEGVSYGQHMLSNQVLR